LKTSRKIPAAIGTEQVSLVRPGGSIVVRFHARDAHVVLSRRAREPVRFRVLVDGAPPGPSHGVDVDANGHGVVSDRRMYQLVRGLDAVRHRTLEVMSSTSASKRMRSRSG
jgi:Thioredoxin like C-terminal domain